MSQSRSRSFVAALIVVLVSALGLAPSSGAEPPTGGDVGPAPVTGDGGTGPGVHEVTLITGDVVRYTPVEDGMPVIDIEPAPRPDDREVGFQSFPTDDGFVVLPEDAIGLVAAGVLERDLFDVPTLVDEQTRDPEGDIAVLIESSGSTAPSVSATTADAVRGAATVRTLTSVDATAVEVSAENAGEFWATLTTSDELSALSESGARPEAMSTPDVKVWLDRTVTAALDDSIEQIGAPTAWDLGFDGTGVTVAVLDTGIDAAHPDFAGRIAGTADFTGSGVTDRMGHGTHVAGIVLGDGAASDGRYSGVAPGADLLVGKVLGDNGSGTMSQIIAGMEWAVAEGADVVNLSLSAGGGPADGSDPMSRALDALAESSDTLFVVAAGNSGAPRTVRSPGAATHALTVGAVDDDDVLAGFSSSGPRGGDAAVKPNLVAPGVAIGSARAAGTDGQEPIDQWYTRGSGTSMAAPHVAGAAAILAQRHPDRSVDDIRDLLVSTAVPSDDIWYSQGGGRLDVAAAVSADVFASASVDFGRLSPSEGSRTERVTFTNTGDDKVTLDLSVDGFRGWSGAPGPDGAVRIAGDRLTIPAGHTRTVHLLVDPRRGDPGAYGGVLTAATSDGETRLTVPFSYYTGTSHRVDFAGRSSDGRSENPLGLMAILVVARSGANSPEEPFHVDAELVMLDPAGGGGALDLAEGDYQLIGMFSDIRRAGSDLVLDQLSVTAPQSVLLDATSAVPVAPEVPEPVDTRGQQSILLVDVAGADDPFWMKSTQSVGQARGIAVTPLSGGGFRYLAQTHAEPAAVTGMQTADGAHYRPTYDVDSTRRLLGDGGTFDAVSVGAGDPADYAGLDVAGKVVVIGVPVGSDGDSPAHDAYFGLYSKAGLAAGMGAAGVVAFMDDGNDPGGYVWNVGALPVFALSAAEGRRLAESASNGPIELTIDGNATAERVYRVRTDHVGEIPEDRAAFGDEDLVRVEAAYHADRAGTFTTDLWATVTADGYETLTPPTSGFTAPVQRTEYVGSATGDVTWLRQVEQGALALRSRYTYDPADAGTTQHEAWFKAPLVPGAAVMPSFEAMPPGFPGPSPWSPAMTPCSLCRDGDRLVPALHWLDSDPRHAGDLDPRVDLFRGDTPIPMADGDPASFVVADDTAEYRLVATDAPVGRQFPDLVTTQTEFTSGPPTGRPDGFSCSFGDSCAFQSAPQLRYDLPLDLRNRADAGAEFGFEVTGRTAAGEPILDLSVRYSTDGGTTWADAEVLAAGDGRFDVVVHNPPVGSGDGHVALQVSGSDAAGNSVEQTIRRAYAVE